MTNETSGENQLAVGKTSILAFRIQPALNAALRPAAEREHRSIANMLKVLIRDYCGRHGITIQAQAALFPGGDPPPHDR